MPACGGGRPDSNARRRWIGKSRKRTAANRTSITRRSSTIANTPAIESESANEPSRPDRVSGRQSKNRPIADAIKQMFKAAAKALGARVDEVPARKRRAGDKESRAPLHRRPTIIFARTIAARGRYASLRIVRHAAVKLRRIFAAAAEDVALPDMSVNGPIWRPAIHSAGSTCGSRTQSLSMALRRISVQNKTKTSRAYKQGEKHVRGQSDNIVAAVYA